MQLELTITPEGSDPVDVVLDLADINAEDTVRAIELCESAEPFAELARGVWNDRAADALLQAALERKLETQIDEFSLDWGPFAGLMSGPDLVLESSLPMETNS